MWSLAARGGHTRVKPFHPSLCLLTAASAPAPLPCTQIETQAPPESCNYFASCFNSPSSALFTDRWAYILIQGLLLGILLDVAQFELFVWFTTKFTEWEHWPTMMQFERKLIQKQFFFCWVNMYFWFFVLAFLCVHHTTVYTSIPAHPLRCSPNPLCCLPTAMFPLVP